MTRRSGEDGLETPEPPRDFTTKVIAIIFMVASVFIAGVETARMVWPSEAHAAQAAPADVVQRLERIEAATGSIGSRLSVLESQVGDLRDHDRGRRDK